MFLSDTVDNFQHNEFALGEDPLTPLLQPMSASLNSRWHGDHRKGPLELRFKSGSAVNYVFVTMKVAAIPFSIGPITNIIIVGYSHKYRNCSRPLIRLQVSKILPTPPTLYSDVFISHLRRRFEEGEV